MSRILNTIKSTIWHGNISFTNYAVICLVDPLSAGLRTTTRQLAKSPNASGIQDWRVNIQTHSPVWRRFFFPSHWLFLYLWPVIFWLGEWKYWTTRQSGEGFFSPLTDSFYIFGQLFSDLASENNYSPVWRVSQKKSYPQHCFSWHKETINLHINLHRCILKKRTAIFAALFTQEWQLYPRKTNLSTHTLI
jgi:hypothetical protein